MGWCPLALPGTAVPGGCRKHGRWEHGRALATALLGKMGTGQALTWLRVSLLPQEQPELNGPFTGQWKASRLAGIPCLPPCPVWGPCCPTPFTVSPELASTGMWLQDSGGTPPAKLLLHAILAWAPPLPSPSLCSVSPLGGAAAFHCTEHQLPEGTSQPDRCHPGRQVSSTCGLGMVLRASHAASCSALTLTHSPHCVPTGPLSAIHMWCVERLSAVLNVNSFGRTNPSNSRTLFDGLIIYS